MRITKHITYYYNLTKGRKTSETYEQKIKYVNLIIDEVCKYKYLCDVFIHSNSDVFKDKLHQNTNGKLEIIVHKIPKVNLKYYNKGHPPEYRREETLTWCCRDLLKEQRNDYDIFIYDEDDILITQKAIDYWLEYKDIVMGENYNLGFIRIEVNNMGEEFISDFPVSKKLNIKNKIKIKQKEFIINDINPYCGSWIYDKKEFNKWVENKLYNPGYIDMDGKQISERSAWGLHHPKSGWYKGTIIPLDDDKLNINCKIYHLPNNYISDSYFATIKFEESIIK